MVFRVGEAAEKVRDALRRARLTDAVEWKRWSVRVPLGYDGDDPRPIEEYEFVDEDTGSWLGVDRELGVIYILSDGSAFADDDEVEPGGPALQFAELEWDADGNPVQGTEEHPMAVYRYEDAATRKDILRLCEIASKATGVSGKLTIPADLL